MDILKFPPRDPIPIGRSGEAGCLHSLGPHPDGPRKGYLDSAGKSSSSLSHASGLEGFPELGGTQRITALFSFLAPRAVVLLPKDLPLMSVCVWKSQSKTKITLKVLVYYNLRCCNVFLSLDHSSMVLWPRG